MTDERTGQTVELLQTLIRNACVNDGRAESGEEVRNADVLQNFLEGTGLAIERYSAAPGRDSLVCRIEGTDPDAPSLCLMGHTDVVPVNRDGWSRDPFGGELVTSPEGIDEVWGRGAVDMLNLTSSMAVAFRHLARSGFRPRGDLIYFAVADEESGSAYGARWMAENHPEAIRADYVLTENGGLHSGDPEAPNISVSVGEKGVMWRKLRIHGVPGHGSMPFRKDNALVQAAAVVQRLADYNPPPRFHELWRGQVAAMGLPPAQAQILLDENQVDDLLREMPNVGAASHLYSCIHTTFSANVADTGPEAKTNVIPDSVDLNIDIRTLPGETEADVDEHLRTALGDLYDKVQVDVIMNDPSTSSRIDTPLWDSLQKAVNHPFGSARLNPSLVVGFTDARVFRDMGSVAYGAGLMSPTLDGGEFSKRFHGHDERVDVESLRLSTQLWIDTATDLLG